MEKNIIEMASFYSKEGVTEAEVIELSRSFIEALKQNTAGLISRSLTRRSEDGKWEELVWWESTEAAQTAFNKAPEIPEFLKYCAVMKEEDNGVYYLEEKDIIM